MNRSHFLALIVLVLTLGLSGRADAASITYNLVDYPDLQFGFANSEAVHLSGTITTNGTTGTNLVAADVITSFTITFSQDSFIDTFSGGSGDIFPTSSIDVTGSSIHASIGGSLGLGTADTNISWSTDYANTDPDEDLEWNTNPAPSFDSVSGYPIATTASAVPLPASVWGGGVLLAGYAGLGMNRRRARIV